MSKREVSHRQRVGDVAELWFWTEATRRGINVSRPFTASSRYDFVADYKGVLSRVQVKGTATSRKCGDYHVLTKPYGRPYTPAEIDFLAVFVVPLKVWYIIPVEEITDLTGLYVAPNSKRGEKSTWAAYRDAWRLLEEPRPCAKCGRKSDKV